MLADLCDVDKENLVFIEVESFRSLMVCACASESKSVVMFVDARCGVRAIINSGSVRLRGTSFKFNYSS